MLGRILGLLKSTLAPDMASESPTWSDPTSGASTDPLLREFEALERRARERSVRRQSTDSTPPARPASTDPGSGTRGQRSASPASRSPSPSGPARPVSSLDAEFQAIPIDLRQRALVWLQKHDIVKLYRVGILDSRVSTWEANNKVRPGEVPRSRVFEANAKPGSDDATVEFPEAYRETGRFGSHPSHDDYSDEGRA